MRGKAGNLRRETEGKSSHSEEGRWGDQTWSGGGAGADLHSREGRKGLSNIFKRRRWGEQSRKMEKHSGEVAWKRRHVGEENSGVG